YADKLILANGKVNIFNTNAWPKKIANKTGKFPHQQLQKLALDLKIDTLQLRGVNINYREFNRKTGKTGEVSFMNTRGNLYNVTNDSRTISKNHFLRAQISTMFLNRANLYVTFNFNLKDKEGAFTSTG